MKEVNDLSEGNIVEVTDLETTPSELFPWLTEGTELEVTNIREKIGRGSAILVTFSPVSDEVPNYKKVTARTYESWPESSPHGFNFDADGHTTSFDKKYFDVE